MEGRPEANNLLGIYAALAGVTKEEARDTFATTGAAPPGFGSFKKALAGTLIDKIRPVRDEANRMMSDPDYIDGVLADGAERARTIAKPVMDHVKDIVGFIRS